jgi:hypothetical protein
MTKLLGLLFIASTTLTACASDSDDEFTSAATELEGIYKIGSYTHNAAACSAGGESRLGVESYAVVVKSEVFGQAYLLLMSCESPANCRERAAKLPTGEGFAADFSFSASELDGDVLLGVGGESGSLEGGKCIGGAKLDTRFARDGARLTIEQRITPAQAYAPEDGLCWTDDAAAAASGSCTELEQLTADFVEAL